MPVQCPHCHSTLPRCEPDAKVITCTECGGSIELDPGSTAAWQPANERRRLGKFEFIEQVGVGAFGTVFKARDTELDRIVAIKIPRQSNIGDGHQDHDRFLREARSAAQLRHPSIVAIHEVGTVDGAPCLISDFIEGLTLGDVLTARRPTPREAAELLATVAEALQHAHEQGVVHRDVKPSNIMIRPNGTPVVMDFGLAKRDAGEITMTMEGQVLGTPAYMSPEQAKGEAHKVDGRSDVYSLGVIQYQLLVGELPFRGNTRMLLHQVLYDEPKPPRSLNDQIPRDLETICLKAMAKEPVRRFQTAQAMADDLWRWLKGEPIQARPVGRAERAWRWVRRNRLVAGLTAAVILVLVAGTIVATYFAFDANAKAKEAVNNAEKEANERRRADRNLRFAIDTVGKYKDVVVMDPDLRDNPTLLPLRRKLLQSAQQFYEQLAGQPDDPPAREANVALAWDRLGQIYHELGNLAQAEQAFQASLRCWQPLVQAEPKNPTLLSALGDTCNNFGNLQRAQGRRAEARKLLEEAIQHQRTALQAEPENGRFQLSLAHHYLNLGYVLADLRETAPALAALDEARKLYEPLAAEDSDALGGLALTYNNRGKTLSDAKRFPEAAGAYKEALKRQEQLAKDEPETPQHQLDLARTWHNLGMLEGDSGHPLEAEKAFRASVDLLQKLVDRYPLVPEYAAALGRYSRSLGVLLCDQNQLPAAAEHLQRAYSIFDRLTNEQSDLPERRDWLLYVARDYERLLLVLHRNREAAAVLERGIALRKHLGEQSPLAELQALAEDCQLLAQTHSEAGHAKEAIAAYRRELECRSALIKLQPNRQTQWAQAVCLMNLGAVESAIAPAEARQHQEQASHVLERLAAEEPNDMTTAVALGGCRCNLGRAAMNNQQWREAREWLGKAVQVLEPAVRSAATNHNASDFLRKSYRGRIEVLDKLGLFEDELADWDRLLALQNQEFGSEHRETVRCMNDFAWFLATVPASKIRDPARALALATKVTELSPRNPYHVGTLGAAQYRAGDFKGALDSLQRATEMGTRDEATIARDSFFLAMVQWQLGDKQKARECFDEAMRHLENAHKNEPVLQRLRDEAVELLGVKEMKK